MSSTLSHALISKLRFSFGDIAMTIYPDNHKFAVFTAVHREIGDFILYDDGDELTLCLGNFTHVHFSNYEAALSDAEKAEDITDRLVDFLKKLFADKIEFFGNERGGGCQERGSTERGAFSKLFFGQKVYVWSGPIIDGSDQLTS